MSSRATEGESIYRIPPYYYIHVLDQNTNVTKVEVGPKTFIRQDNEKVCTNFVPSSKFCIDTSMHVILVLVLCNTWERVYQK